MAGPMHRNRRFLWMTALIAIGLLTVPMASAHETYTVGDGKYELVIGEQNEPVYTYKWTNLDLIIRTASDEHEGHGHGGGHPVEDAHLTLDATFIGPVDTDANSTFSLPLEPQFGEEGRYEFEEGYILTQPGQYRLKLQGQINQTDIDETFDLPGPRDSWSGRSFPDEGVPGIVQLDEAIQTLQGDNQRLEQRVDDLESRVQQVEEQRNTTATTGVGLAAAILAGVAFVLGRRST